MASLATLATAGTAAAGTAKERAPSARLEAVGGGRVALAGRLVAYGQTAARSRLLVRDLAGDAVVLVAGEKRRPNARGWIRVPRAGGRLYVSGSRVTVRLTGTALHLAVAGSGVAILDGAGRYWLNGGEPAAWDRRRLALQARQLSARAAAPAGR